MDVWLEALQSEPAAASAEHEAAASDDAIWLQEVSGQGGVALFGFWLLLKQKPIKQKLKQNKASFCLSKK